MADKNISGRMNNARPYIFWDSNAGKIKSFVK
jgi:hypothetical protein